MKIASSLAVVALVVTTVATGSGCDGGTSSGVSLNDFPSKYAQAVCERNFTCVPPEQIGDVTQSECVDNDTSALQFVASSIADGRAKGRIVYDGEQMQSCITNISETSCFRWLMGFSYRDQPTACLAAAAPQGQPGDPCMSDFECIQRFCKGDDPSSNTEGVCAAADSEGEPCSGSADCSIGLYCDLHSYACAPQKAAGEACSNTLECKTRCDTSTNTCSSYAGCDAAAGDPSAGLPWLLAIGTLGLLRFSSRPRGARPRAPVASPPR